MTDDNQVARGYVDEADWASASTTKPSLSAARRQSQIELAFKPTHLFFYGTLTIPEVLKLVIRSTEEPVLLKAAARTHKIKMWGPYPALVELAPNEPRNPVPGAVYTVRTEEHLKRLVTYEGANYAIAEISVELLEPEPEMSNTVSVKTFVWNGYPEELRDGVFDVTAFQNPRN
ncbi:hypothetical protein H072_3810 [Dactylellina haptotyla CBS 200.50]|uniref:Putative gamma-glutamylcyclotransferase n=1 Tax=Dactylellina haptotyla (strain CBS 200.50) TaxID=1284197 RepID=S8AG63_DACHA|nr:hypothetical protein H072_3810 [Dactylellina haptotyla CBS 200.50]